MDLVKIAPQILSVAGQIGGPLMTAGSQRNAGKIASTAGQTQQNLSNFEAEQYDQAAGESLAVSQRKAAEERRVGRIQGSRALALAAASGGGTGGTVANIIADLAGEGAYRSAVALYEGEAQARKYRQAASGKRYEGKVEYASGQARQRAFNTAANTSLIRGGASLFEKYGLGGFQQTPNKLVGDEYIGSKEWTSEIA
jgi:hypothetical protein